MNKWDSRFLNLAELVASWSKDESTKVGCVIVDDNNRVVSLGYNGFPRGVRDTLARLQDRELKYSMVVHAEENALLFAGRDVSGCTAYTSTFPCSKCAAKLIQAGITRLVSLENAEAAKRWGENFKLTKQMFDEANVQYEVI